MTEENFDFEPEFETKQKKSKDFWLFFIFIDIIALVFCAFLLYQSLSQKFAPPAPAKDNVPVKEEPKPAPQPEKVVPAARPKVEPKAEPAKEDKPSAQQNAPVQPAAVQPAPAAKPEPKVERKESVVIESTKGKTRKVTFKYFGDAKTVTIVSGFTMTKPLPLKKIGGVWQATFNIYPGQYKYMFMVDGKQTLDPHADEKDGRSTVTIK